MKIIDVLNKIANNEEVPKCFKVNNHTWEWNVNSYQNDLHSEFAVTGLRYDLSNLNDEIEIIEEDKKIEPIKFNKDGDIEYCDFFGIHHFNTNKRTRFMAYKINEIIDHLNKGDK